MRAVYFTVGLVSLLLGIIGILLPIMPTLPFLALSAYCFSRSSEKLHNWLLSLPYYGPLIKDWEKHRRMNPWAKWGLIAFLALFFTGLILVFDPPLYGKIGWAVTGSIMILLAIFQLKSNRT